jgi:hypothetical protein
MNNQRRKSINDIIDRLSAIMDELDVLNTEEQDAHDNLPDGLQESERGEAMQEAADALDQAKCDIEIVIDNLQELV